MRPTSNKRIISLQASGELGPLLTIGDLAKLYQVDRRTIKRWCKQGQLSLPLKIGGTNRWRREDIRKTINRSEKR